jgi:dihydrofolate reductase
MLGMQYLVAQHGVGISIQQACRPQSDVALHDERRSPNIDDVHPWRLACGVAPPCAHPRKNPVSKLKVQSFAVSIDGFGAGPGQDLQNPLGIKGPELMEWFCRTRVWRKMHGQDGGEAGVDNELAEKSMAGIGAWILGRNMFGPIRGPWPDDSWKGWWGDEPPYHTPVFVLTHHARAPVRMKGGTEFRFVTEGIHAALEQATAAAGSLDVRLGGGVSTIREYLRGALIDELHLAVRPVLLGTGEHLFNGIDTRALGYECARYVAGERATHVFLRRSA